MVKPQQFGRRVNPQHRASRPMEPVEVRGRRKEKAERSDFAVRPVSPVLSEAKVVTLDDDFQEWRRTRKNIFNILWRPLSLMASLCFGIASFVLPDTVNSAVQWLLYALMAASIYAGFSRRRTGAKG